MNTWCIVMNTWCIVMNTWCIVMNTWCIAMNTWCIVMNTWCIAMNTWCIVMNTWCIAMNTWCIAMNTWCIVMNTWCIAKNTWCIAMNTWCIAMNTWCIVILEALLHTFSYLEAGSIIFPAYPESRTKTLHPVATTTTYGAQIFQISVYPDKKETRCTLKRRSRISMAKATFNKKNTLFTRKLEKFKKQNTSKKLYTKHSFVWC